MPLLALLACTAEDRRPPVLLIAADGVEWDVVLPLLRQGQLPHIAGLMGRGAYGLLETFRPTASPVIWTSIATGKPPARHGIRHFQRRAADGSRRLYHNGDRRTKALWNIASDHERRSAVVGWWMTWPVEPIRGVMVAQTNSLAQLDTRAGRNVWKGALHRGVPGQVHPPERQDEMLAILEATEEQLPELTERLFGRFPHPPSVLGERLWRNCLWAFRADATYLAVTLRLIEEDGPFDLMMVYFGGPDVVGHRFWRYMEPELYAHPPAPEQIENFGEVIPRYYRYLDRAVGELLAALPEDANVILVSDHGMHAVNRDARFDPNRPPADVNSAEHQDAPPGVFVAAGPAFAPAVPDRDPASLSRGDLVRTGSVFDVAPTVLALLGIPTGLDMRGEVLEALLRRPLRGSGRPDPVASHDSLEFLARRPVPPARRPDEAERTEQLRELGYLR